MTLIQDANPADFLSGAGPLLYKEEAEYGLILGLAESFASDSEPPVPALYLRLVNESKITQAVYLQSRPDLAAVSHLSDPQISILAEFLRSRAISVGGFIGPTSAAGKLVASFIQGRSNFVSHVSMSQKILTATSVKRPRPSNGRGRLAELPDLPQLLEFLESFCRECLPHEKFDKTGQTSFLQKKILANRVYVWCHTNQLVATAHLARPTRHGISIGAVYTPPFHRARGYASNLMAQITQEQLDTGRRFCVLYTDATNPTSNKIYESIGYQVVAESTSYRIVDNNF